MRAQTSIFLGHEDIPTVERKSREATQWLDIKDGTGPEVIVFYDTGAQLKAFLQAIIDASGLNVVMLKKTSEYPERPETRGMGDDADIYLDPVKPS